MEDERGPTCGQAPFPMPSGLRLWLYLALSHHRLDDREHTLWFRVGRGRCVPFCSRCTGVYVTFALWLALHHLVLEDSFPDLYKNELIIIGLTALALPFAVQWTWQTLVPRYFEPRTRFATGLLAGIPLAAVVASAEESLVLSALALMGYVVLLKVCVRLGGDRALISRPSPPAP